jgi:hydroxylamine dehydrogenase
MNRKKLSLIISSLLLFALLLGACADKSNEVGDEQSTEVEALTEEAKKCVECHATETPGIVAAWDNSVHAEVAVSCTDCHVVQSDSDLALVEVDGHDELEVSVSMLVPPGACAECHEEQVEQFHTSGHQRAYLQVEANDSMQALMYHHEGRDDPELSGAPAQTGCYQCHGSRIEVDETGHPTPDTYPSSGVGNVYPDGDVGNCTVCHTRHSFSIADARRPEACASCHLGPDHPDIEIYEASKHGQIYHSDGDTWVWDRPPGEWEPGDYTAPTCATCHMSGIGELEVTHNITERLYWNLWAKVSAPRTDPDVMGMYYGDGEAGRELMMEVCSACHSTTFAEGFFASGDMAVQLYNQAYFSKAEEMRAELEVLGLLDENPWQDEFQIVYYYLWHHEGRRARQGALMGGADWAHWHGFFDLMQDINQLEKIYDYRTANGVIEN